jgi:DNA-binding transcriptional MerR regulator
MVGHIPDKLYFKIGEVAELTGVKTHVLRYWETEFSTFKPTKSRTNQRLYRRKDIEFILRIKDLLYNQGFTIAGAKKKLREPAAIVAPQLSLPLSDAPKSGIIAEIRQDLLRLRRSLD